MRLPAGNGFTRLSVIAAHNRPRALQQASHNQTVCSIGIFDSQQDWPVVFPRVVSHLKIGEIDIVDLLFSNSHALMPISPPTTSWGMVGARLQARFRPAHFRASRGDSDPFGLGLKISGDMHGGSYNSIVWIASTSRLSDPHHTQ